MKIRFYGKLRDITGASQIEKDFAGDCATLLQWIICEYPPLKKQVFALAVNDRIAKHSEQIGKDDTVALVPPYSGG